MRRRWRWRWRRVVVSVKNELHGGVKMSKPSRPVLQLLGVALLACATLSAHGQTAGAYPSKTVRTIVPFPAGGNVDQLARLMAVEFTKQWGQNFIVDNRTGGDGIIGTDAVAKAAPDGYTLLQTTGAFIISPTLTKDLPYDTLKDFEIISG